MSQNVVLRRLRVPGVTLFYRTLFLGLLLSFIPAAGAVTADYNFVFQSNGVFLIGLTNSSYDRQNYRSVGANITLPDAISVFTAPNGDPIFTYNVQPGETLTWRWVQTKDRNDNPVDVQQVIFTLTYQGQTPTCDNQWDSSQGDTYCGFFTSWSIITVAQCWQDGDYQIEVSHNGTVLDAKNANPTLLRPTIPIVSLTSTSITPFIPATSGLPPIPAAQTSVNVVVMDNLACGIPLPGIEVQIANTIVPGSASHKHFGLNEPGTGTFIASNPIAANITAFTDSNGNLTATYKAGFYGVQENVTVTAIDPVDGSGRTSDTLLDIRAPGLIPLDSSGLTYTLRGSSTSDTGQLPDDASDCDIFHNDRMSRRSHYVTPAMFQRVQEMVDLFFDETNISLSLNDASLQYGGMFDNKTRVVVDAPGGGRCHASHRRGIDIDVNVGAVGCPNPADPYNLNCAANILGYGAAQTRREVLDRIVEKKMGGKKIEEPSLHYRFVGAAN